ncbi:DUF6779 domain-containing protein [Gordonia sp. (in: high G+C Gram-positive bacteria)]|uniref:DUF6779 domain-containing protein n=1 Tax=Gordonia sp. (in: high G+C Gram-positive bacteria) TaxID=84139 RepID=UPI0035276B69
MASTDSAARAPRRRPRRTATPSDAGGSAPSGADGARAGGTGSPKTAQRSPIPTAQWLLGLFIVLAVIASLLMVFGDDISLIASLAVIAALWAAVIGAVLVTKYRRQADVAESRTRDQRLVYELQLEREIAARRQYEAEVETALRQELAEETNEEFEALKQQVLALRASLEKVLGNPLPDVPPALRPERRRELGSGLSGVAYAGATDDRVAANLDFASTVPPADGGRHAPAPETVVEEVPAAEMTEIIPVVTEERPEFEYAEAADEGVSAGEYGHVTGHAGDEYAADYADARPPADYTATEYHYSAGEYTAVEYDTETPAAQYPAAQYPAAQYPAAQYPAAQYAQQPYTQPEQYAPPQDYVLPQDYPGAGHQPSGAPVPPVPEVPPMPQRGRRASAADDGAHTGGQPVSELLNRLREGSGGGSSSGRRRRG